jgi:hypothetical protein
MDVYWGTGNGATLISSGNQVTGNYIDVSGGKLEYYGSAGVEDTIAVPVLVDNNGNFTVTSSGGGWLIVKGQVAQTKKYSVYMTAGSVNLSNATTLECVDDYQQTSGTLQTTDASYCGLQDGPNGALGTALISGGNLVVNSSLGSGKFEVYANSLNFNGTLMVGITGNQTGVNGQLIVSGNMNNQANSDLIVQLNGALANGSWTIIASGGNNIAPFAKAGRPPGTSLAPNKPNAGDYQVTAP